MVDNFNKKENKEMIDGKMKWTLKPTWSCYWPLMRTRSRMQQKGRHDNVSSGSAISNGTNESHTASKAASQRSRKAEQSEAITEAWSSLFIMISMCFTLGRAFNICTTWDIGLMDIFL